MHFRIIILTVCCWALSCDLAFATRTFLSPGCVNPDGLDSCWSRAVTAGQTCFKNNCKGNGQCTDENNCTSTDATCVSSCVCTAYESWLNCIYTHCWNRVYTCEYQKVLVAALANCPSAGVNVTIPFFPAPLGAPDSCSCDVASLYYRHRTATAQVSKCDSSFKNTTNSSNICACCGASEVVSSFINFCPGTSPSSLSFFPQTDHPLAVLESATCKQTLSGSVNCSDYGFERPGPAGAPFYNASNLPANGTQNLSNTKGNITKPLAGATLVWGLVKDVATTAIADSATSSTGSAAGTTATTSFAINNVASMGMLWGIIMLNFVFLLA